MAHRTITRELIAGIVVSISWSVLAQVPGSPKIPAGFNMSNLPPGFNMSNLPPGFGSAKKPTVPGSPNKPTVPGTPKTPAGFNLSNLPPGINPSMIPKGFNPSMIPKGINLKNYLSGSKNNSAAAPSSRSKAVCPTGQGGLESILNKAGGGLKGIPPGVNLSQYLQPGQTKGDLMKGTLDLKVSGVSAATAVCGEASLAARNGSQGGSAAALLKPKPRPAVPPYWWSTMGKSKSRECTQRLSSCVALKTAETVAFGSQFLLNEMKRVAESAVCTNSPPMSTDLGQAPLSNYQDQVDLLVTFISMIMARYNGTLDVIAGSFLNDMLRNCILGGNMFLGLGVAALDEVFSRSNGSSPCVMKTGKTVELHSRCPLFKKDIRCETWFRLLRSNWTKHKHQEATDVIKLSNGQERTFTYIKVTQKNRLWYGPKYDCNYSSWLLYFAVPLPGGVRKNTYPELLGGSLMVLNASVLNIDQCSSKSNHNSTYSNMFFDTHKCHSSTECVTDFSPGFTYGAYKCVCRKGFYNRWKNSSQEYFTGKEVEDSVKFDPKDYTKKSDLHCLQCAVGCVICYTGDPCIYPINKSLRIIILFLLVLNYIFCIILSGITYFCRRALVLKTASPTFLQTMIWGGAAICVSAFMKYPEPNTTLCALTHWLFHLGFLLLYCSLIIKTWRISVIFSKRSKVQLTDAVLLKILMYPMMLGVVYLITWSCITGFKVVWVMMERKPRTNVLKFQACDVNEFDYVAFGAELLLVLYGVYLCYTVRKAPAAFNESKHITMATYNAIFLGSFFQFTKIALLDKAGPDVLFVEEMLHVQMIVTNTLSFIFVPKVYVLWSGREVGNVTNFKSATAIQAPGSAHANVMLDIGMQTDDSAVDPGPETPASDSVPCTPRVVVLPAPTETGINDEVTDMEPREVSPCIIPSSSADVGRVDEVKKSVDSDNLHFGTTSVDTSNESLLQIEAHSLAATGSKIFHWIHPDDSKGDSQELTEKEASK